MSTEAVCSGSGRNKRKLRIVFALTASYLAVEVVGGLVTGSLAPVLFLALGAGAVFQVAYHIGGEMVWKGAAERQQPGTAFAGVLAGMLVLYLTGVVIK